MSDKHSAISAHTHTPTHTQIYKHTHVPTHTLSALTLESREDVSVGESDTVSSAAAERDTKPALKTSGGFHRLEVMLTVNIHMERSLLGTPVVSVCVCRCV